VAYFEVFFLFRTYYVHHHAMQVVDNVPASGGL